MSNTPVIGHVDDQIWAIGKEVRLKIPISNNPDTAYVHGPLIGMNGPWNKEEGVLEIKGKPSRKTEGKFTIIAIKEDQEITKTCSFRVV